MVPVFAQPWRSPLAASLHDREIDTEPATCIKDHMAKQEAREEAKSVSSRSYEKWTINKTNSHPFIETVTS